MAKLKKNQIDSIEASQVSDFDTEVSNNTTVASAVQPGDLSTVATSGDYNDLSNQPDLSVYDEIEQHANLAAFPGTGDSAKFYLAQDTGIMYRWTGSAYQVISAQLALGETSSTAYRGDRGKIAYDHSQVITGNPHNVSKSDVGLSNVDNTSDASKPVSTATQTALDGKSDTTHTHTASDITDFDTEVANNSAVVANTAKVSNATHTGDVTGSTALTLANTAVTPGSYTNTDLTVDSKGRITAASNGTGGSASPLTTKGDLFTYDTDDQRLAVGTNGQILSADSTEATGLKWIDSLATTGNMSCATFYDGTGGQALTTSFTTVNIDTQMSQSGSVFSLATDEVTISEAGFYIVDYNIGAVRNAGTRGDFRGKLQVDTGGGYADITGSHAYAYWRDASGAGSSLSKQVTYEFGAGDKVKIVARDNVNGVTLVVNASSISLVQLKGVKGDTGATGPSMSDSDVETAYNNQVGIVSQVDAEAGTSTTAERWTPERVGQAIAALGGGSSLPILEMTTPDRSGSSQAIKGIVEKNDGYIYSGYSNINIVRYKKVGDQIILNNGQANPYYAQNSLFTTIGSVASISLSDNYIYFTTSTANQIIRMDISTKTQVTTTLSGIPSFTGLSSLTASGSNVFIFVSNSTNCYKCTVSGTTITYVSTITLPYTHQTSGTYAISSPLWYSGNFYYFDTAGRIVKCSDTGTTDYTIQTALSTSAQYGYGNSNSFFAYNGYIYLIYSRFDSEDSTGLGIQIIETI